MRLKECALKFDSRHLTNAGFNKTLRKTRQKCCRTFGLKKPGKKAWQLGHVRIDTDAQAGANCSDVFFEALAKSLDG